MAGQQHARDRSRRRGRGRFGILRVVLAAVFLISLALVAVMLVSWRAELEYSDQQRACVAQRYTDFDAKKLSQCVDVCKACMNGNTVTCNTSCKLKGAS
jgi:hypothetical protein